MTKPKSTQLQNQVRLQAGKYRGSVLFLGEAAKQSITQAFRPTPARLRETVFNWLGQDFNGLKCLDLFAGSGVMACEAASRGASSVLCVEVNSAITGQLRRNIERIKILECQLWQGKAEDFIAHCSEKFDVVFCDPPYGKALTFARESGLRQVVVSNGWLYFEAGQEIAQIAGFVRTKHTQVGQAHGHLFLAIE